MVESEYNISELHKLSYGLARHGSKSSSYAYSPHEVQATRDCGTFCILLHLIRT